MAYSDVKEAVLVFEAIMLAGPLISIAGLGCIVFKKKDQRSTIGVALSILGLLPSVWFIILEWNFISFHSLDRTELLFLSALPLSLLALIINLNQRCRPGVLKK